MPKNNLASIAKIVDVLSAGADGSARQSKGINLKNYTQITLLATTAQTAATGTALTLMQATDVAGTGLKPLANTVPIWHNANTTASDTLVRQADGLSFAPSTATGNKLTVIHIDPSQLDVNNGFGVVFVQTGAGGAGNTTQITAICDGARYQGDNAPSAII